MQEAELERLLIEIESDRSDRKRLVDDRNAFKERICAFANDLPGHDKPGVLFVGVEDDGSCSGQIADDQTIKLLSDLCSDGSILPIPTCRVQRRVLSGCEVVVVEVEPAIAPPVRFRGRAFVRVGSSTRVATAEHERRLAERRRALDQPYDLIPVQGSKVNELDLNLFRDSYLPSAVSIDVLEQNQRSIEQQLMSLRMISRTPPQVPTVLGLLTLGWSPRDFLPCDYIQFLRIDGVTLSDPIKAQHEVDGPLPSLLRQLDELLRIHISTEAGNLAGTREVRMPDFPLSALQQMTRNAIMHRTYEGTNAPVRIYWFWDRVEIQNPGGPFGQMTRENLGVQGMTDYRNPHLAEAMKNLGYVQRFGAGFEIARKELARNGNPPLEILAEDTHVAVILRSRT